VAQIDIRRESGMGRVAWHWRAELEARGYVFVHLGAAEVGAVHPAFFPLAAYRCSRRLGIQPAAVLVHEPAGAPFLLGPRPVIAFSHGLERRGWEATLAVAAVAGAPRVRPRSRLLFPLWRLRQADLALRHATAVLVLNTDDQAYVRRVYRRRAEDVFLYSNGAYVLPQPPGAAAGEIPSVLFVGAWLPRKGVRTLIEAVSILRRRGSAVRVRLAGTGVSAAAVLAEWPEELRGWVDVIPQFDLDKEAALFARGGLFVLPSYFEGQPLALLQAMAAGCCCIASDVSGNRDLLVDGWTGLLHSAGDAEALAGRMGECLDDPTLTLALGERARRAAENRTWPLAANGVADFIESVIARRKNRVARGGSR
jgi:glycosyltransferase involved in cell wall biosynthesis